MSTSIAPVSTPSPRRAWTHWIYLIYLTNLGWQPVFDADADAVDWAIVATIAVLMVPLWAMARTRDHRRLVRIVVAMVVLGTVGTLFNVGASVLFVYAAGTVAPLGEEWSLRTMVGLTLLIVVLMAVSPIPLPYRIWGPLPSLVFVWVVGLGTARDAANVAEAERLRIDNVRVEALATAAERERIAQDLHDLLGQSLTGLVVRAQLARRLLDVDPTGARDEVEGLEAASRAALQQVRAAVSGLSDVRLDDELDAARSVLEAAGVELVVRDTTRDRPGALVERSLALALREAVTNVVRHAGARTCTVSLTHEDDDWRLEISDDGRGGDHVEGSGLRGMRERIAAVGGRVERWSERGTAVRVTVPT